MFQLELWLLGAAALKRKCAFDYEWKEVPEPSSAIWKNRALIWPFCCTLKWDMGRREGESCPPQLLSSCVGATRYCCARRNTTTWAWAWPHSVLANCFFFPAKSPLWPETFNEWGKRPALCLAGSEAVWESRGELGWDLTGIQQSPVWPIFGIAQVLLPSQMFFTAWELFSW